MKKGLLSYLFLGLALLLGFVGYKIHNRIVNRPPPEWNRQLAEPIPAAGLNWTRCAADGERCEFKGDAHVRYGAGGRYAYRVASFFIDCNAAAFGKARAETGSACEYAPAAAVQPAAQAADPSSPVALENLRTGTASWQLRNPALAGEI